MCEEDGTSDVANPSLSPVDLARQELAGLVAERDRAEALRRDLTDRIRAMLRRGHDVGLSWDELAEIAGYRSADAARVQAIRRDDRAPAIDPPPAGSHTVREAAELCGVSTQTIYDWIKSGRVRIAVDRPRVRRVYLPDGLLSDD